TGVARVEADSVVLHAANLTGAGCIFFQGASTIPPAIVDDGIGCVGGPFIRLGAKAISGNASAYPGGADPRISIRGQIPPAGTTRYYQCYYRNAAAAFCPPASSNRTNGFVLVWVP